MNLVTATTTSTTTTVAGGGTPAGSWKPRNPTRCFDWFQRAGDEVWESLPHQQGVFLLDFAIDRHGTEPQMVPNMSTTWHKPTEWELSWDSKKKGRFFTRMENALNFDGQKERRHAADARRIEEDERKGSLSWIAWSEGYAKGECWTPFVFRSVISRECSCPLLIKSPKGKKRLRIVDGEVKWANRV